MSRAALLVFALSAPVPTQIIVFPVNPDTTTRRFDLGAAAAARAGAGSHEPTAAATPATSPSEQITMTLVLDAADELETPGEHRLTVLNGLMPVISALEQLLYPPTATLDLAATLARLGSRVITPPARPWTVLVRGAGRVLPVKVTGLTITEQIFDARLNPISARAELQLTGLTASELADAPQAVRGLADLHAYAREGLAAAHSARSAANVVTGLP